MTHPPPPPLPLSLMPSARRCGGLIGEGARVRRRRRRRRRPPLPRNRAGSVVAAAADGDGKWTRRRRRCDPPSSSLWERRRPCTRSRHARRDDAVAGAAEVSRGTCPSENLPLEEGQGWGSAPTQPSSSEQGRESAFSARVLQRKARFLPLRRRRCARDDVRVRTRGRAKRTHTRSERCAVTMWGKRRTRRHKVVVCDDARRYKLEIIDELAEEEKTMT